MSLGVGDAGRSTRSRLSTNDMMPFFQIPRDLYTRGQTHTSLPTPQASYSLRKALDILYVVFTMTSARSDPKVDIKWALTLIDYMHGQLRRVNRQSRANCCVS